METTSTTYTVDWYNTDKTIVIMRIFDTLGWDDYRAGVCRVRELMESVSYTVQMIYSMETSPNIPVIPQVGAVEQFTQTLNEQAANHGSRVIVNAPTLVKMTIQLALIKNGHFSKNEVYFTETLDHAERFLNRKIARL